MTDTAPRQIRESDDMNAAHVGCRFEVRGRVQGVGFRPWICRLAREFALAGRVWNHPQGVTIEVCGSAAAIDVFAARLASPDLSAARVYSFSRTALTPAETLAARPAEDARFEIVESAERGSVRLSIPPDLAMCDDCRRELHDPADRRFRYPFINCTQCGPRYTICLDVPYDRARTTMQPFAMCPACDAEYRDPQCRRFHAEPIACPACGPSLRLTDVDKRALRGDPMEEAARLLGDGRIVAIKGLGGFHLACDARNQAAVQRLRHRKHREEKPFAVMYPSLAAIEQVAVVRAKEAELLRDVARPIVLLKKRRDDALAAAVAPGNPWLGVFLPYTPLHELLLTQFGGPLVMTSGNRSDEPIATNDDEAYERLRDIADAFLTHDREIANRCDDSVARVVADQPVLIRRARGYVPSPVETPGHFQRPVLGCGAHLKNAICVGHEGLAWLGPHIGDLETDETCIAYEQSIAHLTRILRVTPRVAAHDLHPDYHSTRVAMRMPVERRFAIQHHHAHIAAVCAEHGVKGPVLGLAWDGTGAGTDGTSWGGEFLWVDGPRFERLATFRPIALAGGDTAIREVWRIALAAIDDAFGAEAPLGGLRLFDEIPPARIAAVRSMISRKANTPPAHGVGRYFDAVGALLLSKARSVYEGQVAVECASLATGRGASPFEFDITADSPRQVDLRAMFRALVVSSQGNSSPSLLAERFHATLVEVATALVRDALSRLGQLPVILGGGCFQNAPLVEQIAQSLSDSAQVLFSKQIPCNDGGLALGQALISDQRMAQ